MGPQSQVKVHGWKDVQNQLGAVSKGEKKEKMKKRGAIEGGPNFWFKTNLSHVQMKQLRLWLWLLATTTTWENQTYHCSRHSHYYRSNQFRRSQRKAYIANTADTNEDQAKFFPGCISTYASFKDLKVPHAKPQLHSCCCCPCSLWLFHDSQCTLTSNTNLIA